MLYSTFVLLFLLLVLLPSYCCIHIVNSTQERMKPNKLAFLLENESVIPKENYLESYISTEKFTQNFMCLPNEKHLEECPTNIEWKDSFSLNLDLEEYFFQDLFQFSAKKQEPQIIEKKLQILSFEDWSKEQDDSPLITSVATWRQSKKGSTVGRFNYASIDCSAKILKANKEASQCSSILQESRDKYFLNPCDAKKWFIIELCDTILIDTLVMSNFELFSSVFKDFSVYVSDVYPAEKWYLLEKYRADNTRENQIFAVDNPLIWTKYIKIEIHSFYDNEYYCPISLVRVHGITMMEDYQNEMRELYGRATENLLEEHVNQNDNDELNEGGKELTDTFLSDALSTLDSKITFLAESLSINFLLPFDAFDSLLLNNEKPFQQVVEEPKQGSEDIVVENVHQETHQPSQNHIQEEIRIPKPPVVENSKDTQQNGHIDNDFKGNVKNPEDLNHQQTKSNQQKQHSQEINSGDQKHQEVVTGPKSSFVHLGTEEKQTQESIFRKIGNHLKKVETNVSLLKRYFEDQINQLIISYETSHEKVIQLQVKLLDDLKYKFDSEVHQVERLVYQLEKEHFEFSAEVTQKFNQLEHQVMRNQFLQILIGILLFCFVLLSQSFSLFFQPNNNHQNLERSPSRFSSLNLSLNPFASEPSPPLTPKKVKGNTFSKTESSNALNDLTNLPNSHKSLPRAASMGDIKHYKRHEKSEKKSRLSATYSQEFHSLDRDRDKDRDRVSRKKIKE